MPHFSEDEIASLIGGGSLERFPPLRTSESEIETTYREIVRDTVERLRVCERTEWNHYGSGYASFIDTWFYFPDGRARVSPQDEHHVGVFVLLSRLSCFYVLGQGEKSWHAKGGASYLPALGMVDSVTHLALIKLESDIEEILSGAGMKRLRKVDLQDPISPNHRVPTIMADAPFTQFDALFYWED